MALGDRPIGFAFVININSAATLRCAPAHECLLSWNTFDENGRIEFRLRNETAVLSPWLPFAEWSPRARRSYPSDLLGVQVLTDTIRSAALFDAVEIRADGVAFHGLALSTPVPLSSSLPYAGAARILDVPIQSQYVEGGDEGWCSPASITMLLRYHGIDADLADVAHGVYDDVYFGCGNWAFNVAYAGAQSLRAFVAYIGSLERAQAFIEQSIPLALSFAWEQGELPGAPLQRSAGHFAVLSGFTANGDCAMNDPAIEQVRVIYPRAAFERCWQRHGGIGYVLAPVGNAFAQLLS